MVTLTDSQKQILKTLIELYEKKGRKAMVKSREVAQALGKDEGTVRNVIMWLKSMGLVESRTGPAGGYVPTLKAYEVLGRTAKVSSLGYGYLIVQKNGNRIRMPVSHMEIMDVFGSDYPRALVRVGGDLSILERGDKIRVESSPTKRLIIEGFVVNINPQAGEVLVDIEKFVVIPDELVGRVASRRLYTLRHDMTVREAAKNLYSRGIRGAPVVDDTGRVVGFLTTTDIAMIIGHGGGLDEPISKYMRRNVFTINENETIIEAIRLMDFYSVGRLLVVDNTGNPVGIITRTDILRFILALQS